MSHPNVKLTYFNFAGRAEPIRVLLHIAGVPYEDEQITFEQWPARQAKEEGEIKPQLPFLYVDGKIKLQSMAILAYAASLAGLSSSCPVKKLNEDMVIFMSVETFPAWVDWFLAPDDKKPGFAKKFREEVLPKYISKLETTMKHAGPGPFAANDTFSVADVMVWAAVAPFVNVSGEACYPKSELAKMVRIKAAIRNVQTHPKVLEYYSTRPEQKSGCFLDI